MMAKQLAIISLAIFVVFGAGWKVGDWYRDSLDLVIDRAAAKAGDKAQAKSQEISRQSARALEDKLEALRNAQPVEIRTELLKPVFTNVCVSDDFVGMYNASTENIERALSGKFVNEMPGKITPP